jgi:CRP/FNR family cyclic AMP-dependent transcriptional regulator
MDTQDLRQAIADTWFGAALPATSLDRLAALGRPREAEPGDTLLTEGAPSRELSLVLRGRVGVIAHDPGQGDITLMTIEPGDIVGWSTLLAARPATATARVIEHSTLVTFPREDLHAALEQDPSLAAAVYRQALDAVARRLLAALDQLIDLSEELRPTTEVESW